MVRHIVFVVFEILSITQAKFVIFCLFWIIWILCPWQRLFVLGYFYYILYYADHVIKYTITKMLVFGNLFLCGFINSNILNMRPLVDTFDDRVVLDISDQIPTPKTNIATGLPTQTHSSKIWSHTTIGTGLTPPPSPS